MNDIELSEIKNSSAASNWFGPKNYSELELKRINEVVKSVPKCEILEWPNQENDNEGNDE